MITLTLLFIFAIVYFVLWIGFKILGAVLSIALFPVKLIFGLIFGLIGAILFPTLLIFFLIPLIFIIAGWLISKLVCFV